MFKKYLSNKIIVTEGLVIILPLIWYLFIKIKNHFATPEFMINSVFLILLATIFIFRSSSLRHLYFAFILLISLVVGNVFGADDFVYAAGSLILSLIILGVINMLFFKGDD